MPLDADRARTDPADVLYPFANERSSPRAVRSLIRPLFPVTDPVGVDVSLVASELVARVIVSSSGGGEVRAWLGGPMVRIEVRSEVAVVSRSNDDASDPRALEIVEALADRWGIEAAPSGGEMVWAEFDASRAEPAAARFRSEGRG